MDKTISIIRIAALCALGALAMSLLFAQEHDKDLTVLVLRVVADKAVAIGIFVFMGRLYNRWSHVDPWLAAYRRKSDEAMDVPNPMQR